MPACTGSLSSASLTGREHLALKISTSRLGCSRGRCSTMKTAACSCRGRAGSRIASASTAPADPPITIASMRSLIASVALTMVPLLVDPVLRNDVGEGFGVSAEAQGLLYADTQKALMAERLVKQPDGSVLKLAVEVDKNIAARNQLHFRKHAVRRQAVVREDDVLPKGLVKHGPAVGRRVVVGKG